ncbi:DUF192 domain-containing protein [Halomonas denitrificans]|uniref:DUF192 domain-containing protein n=1 Tax=Halomonas denitrificans TaxID=370769 RepID=UPI001C99ECA1|nr:DUF192 domain-containing protein [Halomonas denitrificans]MBY5967379.1 DUF192 domain-containing protein [Halomonas denitrificans]
MTLSRRRFLASLALTPVALSSTGLLSQALANAPGLETVTLVIHGAQGPTRFTVEVADDAKERNQGLMGREQLADDAGMLFLYQSSQGVHNGFWMYQTLLPLDIAFIGADGRIQEVRRMDPCEGSASGCPTTRPAERYHAALEVRAGTFDALGVGPGDCVSWPGSEGTCQG